MDADSMFGVNVKMWYFFGFIGRKNCVNAAFLSLVPLVIVLLQILNMYHSWDRIFESGLVLEFFTITVIINSFLRIFTVIAKETKFNAFMKTIDEWCLNATINNDHHALEVLHQSVKRAHLLSNFSWTCGIFGAVMTMIFPLWQHGLPYKVWLPLGWDVYASPLYELMYTVQIAFVVPYVAVTGVSFTIISIVWLIFGIGILRDLHFKLESLTREKCKTEQELLSGLKKCIAYHEYIIDYKNSVEDLISVASFFELLFFSIMLCVLLFFILVAPTLVLQLTTGLYIFFVFYVVSLTYWHANEFSYESERVADAAYNVDWTLSGKEVKKCLLILIARSQNPLTIYAGGIYPMNLETFRALLNTSYSFWTLLRTLSVKNKLKMD